ncbi:MAG: arabinan endo-1,5-alpha-L-arabinosidase [Bacteroidetes bacterium]|nr:arabinan endo-1,5-alpha-L-arabinosidase [Bacteroidota bacterium]
MITLQSSAQTDTSISVHDPVIIRQDSTYYIFCTGNGISVFSSIDMKHWKKETPVFKTAPQWAVKEIHGFKGHIWAPDISYHNGQYYLYYAVSLFGKNTSAIGVATNNTLDPSDKNFNWVDHGKVIESIPGRDMWNAIDPNLIYDENEPWLAFGSFWDGIKLVKLDSSLTKPAEPETWFTIARRARNYIYPDSAAGDAAIEAPFIYKKGHDYFLFVSFDYCCRGVKSTYKMMVGRSSSINGPYLDKEGVPMNLGGGTLLLEGDKDWNGVGHNAVANFNGVDYLIFHGYDANDNGKPKLRIERLNWINGWPVVSKHENN